MVEILRMINLHIPAQYSNEFIVQLDLYDNQIKTMPLVKKLGELNE